MDLDSAFDGRVKAAYAASIKVGLWAGTCAAAITTTSPIPGNHASAASRPERPRFATALARTDPPHLGFRPDGLPQLRWHHGKVPAGRVNDAIFATLDFMPTFASLAGFQVPQDRVLDGFDQTDLLLDKRESGSRDHYFYHSGAHGVRQGPWKLLKANRWPADFRPTYPKDRGSNKVEIYHLDTDLSETTNLAAEHPGIVARLSALALPEEKPGAPQLKTAPAKAKAKAAPKPLSSGTIRAPGGAGAIQAD